MAGKGSGRRPLKVTQGQFDSNWDKIFKNKGTKNDEPANKGTVRKAKS